MLARSAVAGRRGPGAGRSAGEEALMSKQNWRTLRYLALVGLLVACRGEGNLQAQDGKVRQSVREQLGPVAALDTTTAFRLSNTFRAAADRALPAVVAIQVMAEPQMAQGNA